MNKATIRMMGDDDARAALANHMEGVAFVRELLSTAIAGGDAAARKKLWVAVREQHNGNGLMSIVSIAKRKLDGKVAHYSEVVVGTAQGQVFVDIDTDAAESGWVTKAGRFFRDPETGATAFAEIWKRSTLETTH